MKYTTQQEKQQIEREFKALLAKNGMTLKRFCSRNKLNYATVYGRFTRNSLEHDFVNELIHKVDKNLYLISQNGKLIISRKF